MRRIWTDTAHLYFVQLALTDGEPGKLESSHDDRAAFLDGLRRDDNIVLFIDSESITFHNIPLQCWP